MGKKSSVHIITAYLEFLMDQGIRSEYYYVGDASRYLRFLLAKSDRADVEAFLGCASSPAYRRRLLKTVRKFYAFAQERLGLPHDPTSEIDATEAMHSR